MIVKTRVKKVVVLAAVLLVIGVMGSVFTGIRLVPTVMNEINRVRTETSSVTPTCREVYSSSEDIESLEIESIENSSISVEIKKVEGDTTSVKVYEYVDNDLDVKTDLNNSDGVLTIQGYKKKINLFEANSLKKKLLNIYNKAIYNLAAAKNTSSQIVIEVPNSVSINFASDSQSNLSIRSKDAIKGELSFRSMGGNIDIPVSGNLEKMYIDTHGYIKLDVKDFINCKNVTIKGYNIDIIAGDMSKNYYNVTKYPSSVVIEGEIVNINSYIPLGNHVAISGSEVNYEGDFERFPIDTTLRGEPASISTYTTSGTIGGYTKKTNLGQNYSGILGTVKKTGYIMEISNYNNCTIKNK